MLISYKYKFLFVHIAKTGGTSIRAALAPLLLQDGLSPLRWLCHRLSHATGHRLGSKFPRHAKAIAALEMLPRETFFSLYRFAFVRNPWDLQVSSYHHLKRERPALVGECTFKEFLAWKLDPKRPYQYHLDTSITLQSRYLYDLEGKILVNKVGRYERLAEDFAEICQTIGIPTPKLPHHRQAKDRAVYRNYYDTESLAWVAEFFKEDIEKFDYRF
jgi:hypothetical protein